MISLVVGISEGLWGVSIDFLPSRLSSDTLGVTCSFDDMMMKKSWLKCFINLQFRKNYTKQPLHDDAIGPRRPENFSWFPTCRNRHYFFSGHYQSSGAYRSPLSFLMSSMIFITSIVSSWGMTSLSMRPLVMSSKHALAS